MDSPSRIEPFGFPALDREPLRSNSTSSSLWSPGAVADRQTIDAGQPIAARRFFVQLGAVFLAYYVAGKLGQATTNIRSSNLGPVWPAYGIALAAFLSCGYRVWPGIAASAFLVAVQSAVSPLAAAGQAAGATIASLMGAFLLRRRPDFDPSLSRLRDALALIVVGAFGSAILSASIGLGFLYVTGIQAYSGLAAAWLIYWLGDSTGVLLVTPLVFTLPDLFRIRSRPRVLELAALLALLIGTCFVIFGDLPLIPIRLHALAFAVLPFVMWGAIDFGIGGAALSVFLIATIATLLTALGHGPFAANTPFVNAALLDVLFAVLAVSGLALAAVIAERERAERDREQLVREQSAIEARLLLAAIVDSSNDAIVSKDMDGIILSWNAAAERIFGFTQAEAIGKPITILVPPELQDEEQGILQRLKAGERVVRFATTRLTKAGRRVDVSLTISPIRGADGSLVGASKIARDITEQKRAEEAISSVSRRLIEAQEQERTRIARELHDDIGQRLALLTIELTGLAAPSPESPEVERRTMELSRQASQLASDVQSMSHELHSAKIDILGLATGMRTFCTEFADQQKARVDFTSRDLPAQLPSNVSLCLYRVLQEALHNAAKHSGVHEFRVQLWGSNGEIHLTVKDPGAGFDVEAARASRGLGLVSMKERIKLVDGTLSIDSRLQHGTTIHARVPVGSS